MDRSSCDKSGNVFQTALLVLSIVVLLRSSFAWAVNDLLLLPSMMSPKASKSLLLDVARAGDRLIAVGERGHVLLSDDNGQVWRQVQVPVSVTLTAVYFPTEVAGWIVGHDGVILHSNDGGENWQLQLDGITANELLVKYYEMLVGHKQAELESIHAAKKEDLSYELENLLFALDDTRLAIEERSLKTLLDVWFADETTGFVVGAYGVMFRTGDGGKSWEPFGDALNNPEGLHLNAISSGKAGLFIAGEAGTVYHSIDGGTQWDSLESPYQGSFFSVVASEHNEQVYLLGLRGNGFRSDDGGASWRKLETPIETPLFGGFIRGNGTLAIVSNKLLIADSEKDLCSAVKVNGTTYSAVSESSDGSLILVGLDGVRRIEEIN